MSKFTAYSVDKNVKQYDEYKFTLPELYRDVAKEELHEDDEVRAKALTQMRQWIVDNPHIHKCRMDAKFLLRFLRFRQFSVPMACEALERYLTMREMYPSWFKKLDCNDAKMKELFDYGSTSILGSDSKGRTVVFFRIARFTAELFAPPAGGIFIAMLIENMLEWEEVQIGGLQCYASVSEMEKHFDPEMAPKGYGGTVDLDAVVNPAMWKRIVQQRDVIVGLDQMAIDFDYYAPIWDEQNAALPVEVPSTMSKFTAYSVDKNVKQYDEYKFTLPELYRDVAREELHEDDEVRAKALTQMRQWIVDNPHIHKCRMDASFLLRFLRFRQFSVPMACEALERYLTMREMYPSWFKKLDCNDAKMKELYDYGSASILGSDSKGRTVAFFRIARIPTELFVPPAGGSFLAMLIENMLEWEEVQIGGLQVMVDYTNMDLQLLEKWNSSDFKLIMDAYTQCYPIRYKDTHAAKLPKKALPVIEQMLSFTNPKFRERINCYASVSEMEKHFDPEMAPKGYGGTVDLDAVVNPAMWKRIVQQRDVIIGLDQMAIDFDYYAPIWDEQNAALPVEVTST
uniref:CRAL-TRIO domain-containing protein n=1 Tax=Anopheles dirus TaxID=7168 RepID=A0A182N7S8_9DIPT